MPAVEAAAIFHDWAFMEGLMPEGPLAPLTSTPAQFASIEPLTDMGRQWLRAKQVQSVGSNALDSKIIVFLKRAASVSKKQLNLLPKRIGQVEITYRQGLQVPITGVTSTPFGGPAYVVRMANGQDVYACGSSVSVGNARDAGTFGALVRDANGVLFGLSNNHVTGGCSFAGVGMPILAHGVYDIAPNSLPPFTIGFHAAALPMVPGSSDNVDPTVNLDAATFRIADEAKVTSFQGNAYDTPFLSSSLAAGMSVEKVGRTTGHTRGTVVARIHGAFPVAYSAAQHNFNGSVSFTPVFAIAGTGDLFSDSGDSGSLVTTIDQNGARRAVGIVIAGTADSGAAGGKLTIVLPIEPTLQKLGVTLVSNHNI
ncbi:MAG: hypothetical protein EOP36_00420 [Rubrivivax sp.]|nr:MAG: hypothetical protein EOP36_00420 [Rubrivivax sp.]